MTISDWLMIAAVLIAPFLAVFVQKKIEIWKKQRDQKLNIFKTLMATRGATLSPNHVEALNMIYLEFSDKNKNEKKVKQKWKEYLDHLCDPPQNQKPDSDEQKSWNEKRSDFLAELLQEMGICLGYDFDKVQIKKGIYSPQGHAQDEIALRLLRFHAIEVLSGRQPLSTMTTFPPADEETIAAAKRLLINFENCITGKNELLVKIKDDERKESITSSKF